MKTDTNYWMLFSRSTTAGLVLLLLLFQPLPAAATIRSDWTKVQAVSLGTPTTVVLYKDQAPPGKGPDLSFGHRQAAVGRDALEAGPGARHPSGPTRIPAVIPRLVWRDRPAARGCRGVFGACRSEQGRGGLCAIGPDQSTSDPDAGLGGLFFRDGPSVNTL